VTTAPASATDANLEPNQDLVIDVGAHYDDHEAWQ
jgi:hypothetical protein